MQINWGNKGEELPFSLILLLDLYPHNKVEWLRLSHQRLQPMIRSMKCPKTATKVDPNGPQRSLDTIFFFFFFVFLSWEHYRLVFSPSSGITLWFLWCTAEKPQIGAIEMNPPPSSSEMTPKEFFFFFFFFFYVCVLMLIHRRDTWLVGVVQRNRPVYIVFCGEF